MDFIICVHLLDNKVFGVCVVFVHIMKEHQLTDSPHKTQLNSEWQLTPFYK